MSKYRVKVNGKTYELEIERIDEEAEKTPARERKLPDVPFKKGAAADPVVRIVGPDAERQTQNNDNMVCSPMPGVIVKVLAGAGDPVGEGAPILVLEAMKMENEICAPFKGRIKTLFVSEGQTVIGGAPLLEMEPEG